MQARGQGAVGDLDGEELQLLVPMRGSDGLANTRSGEFVMIGLPGQDGGKPVLRAYSIASPHWDEELEFFSIKVPDGPLTSRLQKIQVGDHVL
ncbi:MAG: hypothetical protein EON87_21320, partial [Brevundimonas sp.]